MAKKVEIEIDVNTNIEPSLKQLRELKKQLRETAAGSDEFKRVSKQIKDVEDALEEGKVQAKGFKDQLEEAPGPIGAIFQGMRKLEIATKSFGAAFKAIGIGLLVSLVAGLAAAFSQSEEAGKKLKPILEGFEKIFNGIFRALEPVFNTMIDLATKAMPYVTEAFSVAYSAMSSFLQGVGMLGRAIGKLLSGDFAGAWDDASNAVTGFGERYDEARKGFEAGTKELTKAEKEELEKRKEQEAKALEERKKKQEEYQKKVAEDRKTADQKLLDLQNEYQVLSAKSQDEANKIKLKQELDAQIKDINQLLISQKRKDELIAQARINFNKKIEQIDEERRKQEVKDREDANKDLIKLTQDLTAEVIKDEIKKSQEILKIQFDRQKQEIEQSKAGQEEKAAALLALEKKYQSDLQKIDNDAREKQKQKDLKNLDDQLRLLELRGQVLQQGTQAYFANQEQLLRTAYEKEKMLAQGNADQLLAIEQKYQNDKKNLKQQEIAAYGQVASAVINSFAGITAALASGYDEEAKTSKKAFEQRKKLQKATAIMSAASGIIQILTQPSVLPSPFDWIVKVANAAALGITTAVQISQINKTKFEGGDAAGEAGGSRGNRMGRGYAEGGLIGGRRHSQGGTMIEAERGEAIMTRGAVTMFAPLLSMMNQMGGGVSFNSNLNTARADMPTVSSPSQEQAPMVVKTYVVEQELTNAQQRQARLKDLSTL